MQIDQTKCMKCGSCQASCPMQAIELTDTGYQINKEKCVGCGICASCCPAMAISAE